jgi:hypothetical protein
MRPDFAEFDPRAWQEDGLLLEAPHTRSGWIGTRVGNFFGSVTFAAAVVFAMTAPSTLRIDPSRRGEAAMQPRLYAPFGAATCTPEGTVDLTPARYWESLGKRVSAWPTLPEVGTESEADPLL